MRLDGIHVPGRWLAQPLAELRARACGALVVLGRWRENERWR